MNSLEKILVKYWGYSKFRPLQEEIINSVLAGKDTLGLMPTGGGKSVIFQVASLAMDGICIIVTPLIALMKDQVDNLNRRNIRALSINSGMTSYEINIVLDNCVFGDYKFLYVSPERLKSEYFIARLKQMKVNLITVDEAHCISQWGYDFRPSYMQIAEIREYHPDVPVLALTATATPEVVDDIQERLKFKEKNVFSTSFERSNLTYLVREKEDKLGYLLSTIKKIKGVGIIYVRSRKKTKDIAGELSASGIHADFYHAGLPAEIREQKQNAWKKSTDMVMVCTNAFGMGIDKDNVSYVIHLDLPESPEAYFQEAGRAGRDGKPAFAVLVYDKQDMRNLLNNVAATFPEIDHVKNVYQALANHYQIPIGSNKGSVFDFFIDEFVIKFRLEIKRVYSSIGILQQEGYIELTEAHEMSSKVKFIVERDALYKFQVEKRDLDGFIKLLLRTYSGVFSDYVKIDEHKLARLSNVSVDVIKKYLHVLDKFRIINYFPKKTNPLLIYLEERLPQESLLISRENYHYRKERYVKRVEAMLRYATNHTKCRSQQLLEYFGQTESSRCGQCDVCRERNTMELSKLEFDHVLDSVKKLLKKNSLTIHEIIETLPYPEEHVIKVVDFLLENEKIVNDGSKLKWHK